MDRLTGNEDMPGIPMVEVTFSPSRGDLTRATWFVFFRSWRVLGLLLANVVIFGVAIGFAAGGGIARILAVMLIYLVFVAALAALRIAVISRRSAATELRKLTVSALGITREGPSETVHRPWSEIGRVYLTGRGYIVTVPKRRALYFIPRAAFNTSSDSDRFLALVPQKLSAIPLDRVPPNEQSGE